MITRTLLATLVFDIVACGERGAGSADRSGTDAADTISGRTGHMGDGHGSMDGMPSMAMMRAMRLHMDSMASLPPDQIQAMMATHQKRTSAMLDAMSADMRGMRMTSRPGPQHWASHQR
jgi:hypothetical protein